MSNDFIRKQVATQRQVILAEVNELGTDEYVRRYVKLTGLSLDQVREYLAGLKRDELTEGQGL